MKSFSRPRSLQVNLSCDLMTIPPEDRTGIREWFRNLPRGNKIILIVFLIWLVQAIPKWTAAITADGEMSARIMKVFVTPK